MSNTLAIGAVTATLKQLLSRAADPLRLDPIADPDLADATCTARPLDKARTAEDANQLNVFLYQTQPSAALRNTGMPMTRAGDATIAPLALNLFYLVTAYGRNLDDVLGHRLLGRAMSILHDNPTLDPGDIAKALPGGDLAQQIELVRVTPHALSTEEVSKLWSTFQAPYRLSVAYEVHVVLIESNRPSKAAPPVIWRGPQNRGNDALAQLLPTIAELTDFAYATESQPSARPGEVVAFSGHDLAAAELDAVFTHQLTQVTLTPPAVANATGTGFQVALPPASAAWPAGTYAVNAIVKPVSGPARTTGALAITLAPAIVAVAEAQPVPLDASGNTTLTVTIDPPVWAQQRVSLLVGDLEYPARALPASPATVATIAFAITGRGAGTYALRVRVDGVDSSLVRYDTTPISMDPSPVLRVKLQ